MLDAPKIHPQVPVRDRALSTHVAFFQPCKRIHWGEGRASEREGQGVGRVGSFGPTGWEIHKARAGRGGGGMTGGEELSSVLF